MESKVIIIIMTNFTIFDHLTICSYMVLSIPVHSENAAKCKFRNDDKEVRY